MNRPHPYKNNGKYHYGYFPSVSAARNRKKTPPQKEGKIASELFALAYLKNRAYTIFIQPLEEMKWNIIKHKAWRQAVPA